MVTNLVSRYLSKVQLEIKILDPIISNIVSTSNLNQNIDLHEFVNFGWAIYDQEIYQGVCGYIKPPEMKGKVSIFQNGKMISLGAKSIKGSFQQLYLAKFLLLQNKLIFDTKLQTQVQNIVGTITLDRKINLNTIHKKWKESIYNPNRFAALRLKRSNKPSYLVFSTGKIVITGAKTIEELINASNEIQQKLFELTP